MQSSVVIIERSSVSGYHHLQYMYPSCIDLFWGKWIEEFYVFKCKIYGKGVFYSYCPSEDGWTNIWDVTRFTAVFNRKRSTGTDCPWIPLLKLSTGLTVTYVMWTCTLRYCSYIWNEILEFSQHFREAGGSSQNRCELMNSKYILKKKQLVC